MDVTSKQLAAALDHQWVYASNREGTHHAQIADPDNVARELWEKLAHLADRDLADRPALDTAVDAHVCCEHVQADPELSAMAALAVALPAVSRLGEKARGRVMDWARRRATDGLPPF